MRFLILGFLTIYISFCIVSCAKKENTALFSKLSSNETGIKFKNELFFTEEYNPYTFKNFFNGGGVGVADINNDGLPDIYFAGNLSENKLYLNKGNFKFVDITSSAGVQCEGVWSTGISFVDINSDGWTDIYVCKSGKPTKGKRHNELFINNKNLTFTERSEEYGLNYVGLSTHAAFFDYDKDGDLDCYLLNNSLRSVGGYDIVAGSREIRDSLGGNKLLRNDYICPNQNEKPENVKFTDITNQAGIYNSSIGFGLGVSISDLNNDGWQDIFVSNDFFERDYLYINNQDGTFHEKITDCMPEISLGSMGADIADINNDGWSDIFVTEMLPEKMDRYKTKSIFENWDKYLLNFRKGYHRQFGRNMLHLNMGNVEESNNPKFVELSRYSGLESTDWSWGALVADFDNDGLKDIFVANGILKDLTDLDYVNYGFNTDQIRNMIANKEKVILKLLSKVPSEPLHNYIFKNEGNLKFSNMGKKWGIDEPTFSNGSAYADFDNDGDLDLVVNNINSEAHLYRNNLSDKSNSNYINISLIGKDENKQCLGSKVICYAKNNIFQLELNPMKGFQSCVDSRLHFGLGSIDKVDSIVIFWPNSKKTKLENNIPINKFITIKYEEKNVQNVQLKFDSKSKKIFSHVDNIIKIDHIENEFSDFDHERLLFFMNSNEGPYCAIKDINNDNLEDIVVGGSVGQSTKLYKQDKHGKFNLMNIPAMAKNSISEDGKILVEDFNNDGYQDIFVCEGSSEHSNLSEGVKNRLYLGTGSGFREDQHVFNSLYQPTSTIVWMDFDNDGKKDIFTGSRLESLNYGIPCSSYVYKYMNGGYVYSATLSEPFKDIGMVIDAKNIDLDGDNVEELIIMKDLSNLEVFKIEKSKISKVSKKFNLDGIRGYWSSMNFSDMDGDGDTDILVCNKGQNNRFSNKKNGLEIHVNDFDGNGEVEQIFCYEEENKLYPWVSKDELVKQIPQLKKKILMYKDYSKASMSDLFDIQILKKSIIYRINELNTGIFYFEKGKFSFKSLPDEAQWTDQKASIIVDVNNDQLQDIILGGNQFRAKPEIGINAASYGMLFMNHGNGNFKFIENKESGICIDGEIRSIKPLTIKGEQFFLFARNNDNFILYKLNN